MRLVYSLALYLAVPIAFAVQLVRGVGNRAYRERASERFGFVARSREPTLWVHAVSVGEVRAAAILIPRLKERWPALPIVVTTTTPTGARQVRDLFGDSVRHCYLPFDLPGAVRRFLDRVQPRAGIVMETEIWPNLYLECSRRGIPLTIASARLSARSVSRYRQLPGLLRQVFAGDVTVAAQTAQDAARYIEIGAATERTHVTGNVKFDLTVPATLHAQGQALRDALGTARPVWIAGSTREGEEDILLDAHLEIRIHHPTALLVLVPRHPQRFAQVAALLARRGIAFVTHSSRATLSGETAVFLVDTVGELLAFYAAADVAFVGGTLVPIGGHNLLEPAALGVPVLTGPHVFNAPEAARLLLDAGAAIEIDSAGNIAATVITLFNDAAERRHRGEVGVRIIEENRGAVERVLRLVERGIGEGS